MRIQKLKPLQKLATLVTSIIVLGFLFVHIQRYILIHSDYEPAPEGMVFVPAGYYISGSNDAKAGVDIPKQSRVFQKAFYIDRYEVSNADFQRWRKTHSFEAGEGDLPVTSIYKADAEAYAAQFGKSLPTSKQWEKAARGTDARRFPWGDHYESKRANLRSQGATDRGKLPVDSFPDGVSPYGCYNMSGNVWEWVSDEQGDLGKDANGKTIKRGIIRGGAHRYAEFQGHVSHKTYEDLKSACSDLGFRCAKEAKPKGILSIF